MSTGLDLAALLSPDNALRSAAEQALDAAQAASPAQFALHLTDTVSSPATEPAVRELSAVLLRRRLPAIFEQLSNEWREAVKGKLLEALAAEPGTRAGTALWRSVLLLAKRRGRMA